MQSPSVFVDVILPLQVQNNFTYSVPAEMEKNVRPGMRVLVQFGKSKFYSALIRRIHQNPPIHPPKGIEEVLDEKPLLDEIHFLFWEWISYYYMCTIGEVMSAALPAGLKMSSETKILLSPRFLEENPNPEKLTDQEFLICDALKKRKTLDVKEAAIILSLKNPQNLLRQMLRSNIINFQEEVRDKYGAKKVTMIKLNEEFEKEEKLNKLLPELEKKSFPQLEIVLHFIREQKDSKNKWLSRNSILKNFKAHALEALIQKNVLTKEIWGFSIAENELKIEPPYSLQGFQSKALADIKEKFTENDVCLLHGITGSGKTEIYCHLIAETLNAGKQVLYLVPEIALTTQLLGRLKKHFGPSLSVFHSRFSGRERLETWQSLNKPEGGESKARVILGARSAVLLPFRNLGLIVVDEEHDSSYKQHDPAPRYHARDAAIYMASLHNAKVVLGTATPCIESYFNATNGKYGLVNLNERFQSVSLPEIKIIDLRNPEEAIGSANCGISASLKIAVEESLKRKEQVILFQNRRGFAPYTECSRCSFVPQCIQCDVSLIYHKTNGKLTCHYCGYSILPLKNCPACGNIHLLHKGLGTQKIEEELSLLIPEAKVKRLDSDAVRGKYAFSQIIESFDAGETDILVGTQMVTKGLDFDQVGLVGVVQADAIIRQPDFRSAERAFQIITQVAGRAGRKNVKGLALIQTSQPENKIFDWVCRNDYSGMYEAVLNERREFGYPPFLRLIHILVISMQYELLQEGATFLAEKIKLRFGNLVLGPAFPHIPRVRGEYRKQILLKIPREFSAQKIRFELLAIFEEFRAEKIYVRVKLKIDVDPN